MFSKFVCSELSKLDLFYERIEPSKGMTVGIPDLFVLNGSKPVFIELKVGEIKDGLLFCRDIRPAQFIWHHNYALVGGNSFFLCGVKHKSSWSAYAFNLETAKGYLDGLCETNLRYTFKMPLKSP